ncbi:MAG: cytochrome c biogenesis protein CcsA [Bdellovibrionota bacterium]
MNINIHILLNIISLMLLTLSMSFSTLYVLQQRWLKTKQFTLIQRLPSLETSDLWAARLLVCGWIVLLSSTLIGIYIAHDMWDQSWHKNPKILMAMTTCFWYLVFIIMRAKFDYRGSKFSLINLLGYTSLLITFVYSIL